ncbi:MAG: hypothetical protein IKS82_01410, partial [Bacteroidales bacterium]|nr:hypothetical protein [Bacteroidales bacterium]
DGKTTYTNPSQRPARSSYKVTKIIRSKTSTIVHLYISGSADIHDIFCELTDEDTNKKYMGRNSLNFTNRTNYTNYTFKIEFPPLPNKVSEVNFHYSWIDIYNIKIPPVKKKPANNSGNKTVIINM